MSAEIDRQWVVMKFGGTSVSSNSCWSTICQQATARLTEGKRVLIVVSALSGVTNLLASLADGGMVHDREELLAEVEARHRELLSSLGLQSAPEFERHWGNLFDLASRCKSTYEPGDRALLLAHGELLSSSIGKAVLRKAGLDANWQDARNLLSAQGTDVDLLAARCDDQADPGKL